MLLILAMNRNFLLYSEFLCRIWLFPRTATHPGMLSCSCTDADMQFIFIHRPHAHRVHRIEDGAREQAGGGLLSPERTTL